jgi:hypothetical protein
MIPATSGPKITENGPEPEFFRNFEPSTENSPQSKGVSSGRTHSSVKHYDKWLSFTHDSGLDPFLEAFDIDQGSTYFKYLLST